MRKGGGEDVEDGPDGDQQVGEGEDDQQRVRRGAHLRPKLQLGFFPRATKITVSVFFRMHPKLPSALFHLRGTNFSQ